MTAQTEIDRLPGVVAIADPYPTDYCGPGRPAAAETDGEMSASESDGTTPVSQGGDR